MYLDCKGLVTTGVGNLIDPVGAAMGLPWIHIANLGQKANRAEIAAEWNKMKSDQTLARKGYQACGRIASLMLNDDGIDALVEKRLVANEKFLKVTFRDWDEWPADAQLAVLSMAWAMGAGFTHVFKHLTVACLAHNWSAAADPRMCNINSTGNPGVIPRNKADCALFASAADVVATGKDPSLIYGFVS
jgi:GH24 family phage-related lysozyme (muramidase)